MAKTQKASQSKFNKAAAELHGAYPAEPPAKRVRVKSKEPPASQAEAPPTELPPSTVGTEVKAHGGATKKPPSRYPARNTPVKSGPPTASWDNFKLIQEHYRLSEEETTAVLLDVLGPDQRGSGFWREYQRRVKEELLQVKSEVPKDEAMISEVTTAAPTVMLHDNQLGDPDLCPEYENGETDNDFDEEFEEEPNFEEDLEMEVAKGDGGGDDADSPSGAVKVTPQEPEMMVSAQPTCPQEPVKGGGVVRDDAVKDAADEFKSRLSRLPTPGRGREREGSRNVEADSPDHYKSLLSPA